MAETSSDRANARLDWVRGELHDPAITLVAASGDASFRSYWRTQGGAQACIVMDAPPDTEDLRAWLDIDARLARIGVHVPAVHAHDTEQGFALIEDFGERPYLSELNARSVDRLYADALRALLVMQTRGDTRDLPAYDDAFLRREMELLAPWFLERHLGVAPTATDRQVLATTFEALVANATGQPQCFVHRDFHSRNLMLVEHANPGVIDFQGAVRGPVTYDLASLLRDCYIVWADAHVERWMEDYRARLVAARLVDNGIDVATFRRWFDLAGLQRHIKVLGLFCRLAYRDGKPAYLGDLPRVFDYVLRVGGRYDEMAAFAALLRRATGARDLTRMAASTSQAAPCAH